MNYQLFGLIIAFIYSYLILPRKSGGMPKYKYTLYPIINKTRIIIPISKRKAVHIHHWIICLNILIFKKNIHPIIFGFLFGLIIQGLSYNDAFVLLIKNPYINY